MTQSSREISKAKQHRNKERDAMPWLKPEPKEKRRAEHR